MNQKESALFVASTMRSRSRLDSIKLKDEFKNYLLYDQYFRVIAEWEYYAVLQLMQVEGFESDKKYISRRIGIPEWRVIQVVDGLCSLGLIRIDSAANYIRLTASLETSEDVESQALKNSHIDQLKIAAEKISSVPTELRDFSSITMAISTEKLLEAKAIIREFQEKLYTLLSEDSKTEVYQFNCQLFPLSIKDI